LRVGAEAETLRYSEQTRECREGNTRADAKLLIVSELR
jgi:hypothetical protein